MPHLNPLLTSGVIAVVVKAIKRCSCEQERHWFILKSSSADSFSMLLRFLVLWTNFDLQLADVNAEVVYSKLARDCPLVVKFYNATCQQQSNGRLN